MQSTRQQILQILKERTQATVEQLSEELELTPVTVRHHLDVLRGEGLVDAPVALHRSGPGRPQYAYALTEAAGDYFPKNYHKLADLLFEEIRGKVTPTEMERMMDKVADRLAAQAPPPALKQSPRKALEAAVRFLNEQGYVARWEKTADGRYVLHTCNCPYEQVAQAHPEVCSMDKKFVHQVFELPLERMSHMASGDDSCSYLIDFEQGGS
jgi:predicted ArsR family transcriptional regulator